VEQKMTQVFGAEVINKSEPITIKTSGNLTAKNRMELYAEVGGLFDSSAHAFKPGVYFKKGEVLLEVDHREEIISLKAQRSTFFNQLVLLLPDLKFDYPEAVKNWETYISKFTVDEPTAEQPKPSSEKEKLFVISRNIYTLYYNIKNSEQQLDKFVITAPYDGILIEALADPGTLIRTGQKLGEFISPYTYELEVAINTSYADLLSRGKNVKLYNVDRSKSWQGTVKRVNSTVDPGSQTIPTYIEVRGADLKEGMYLEADVEAKMETNVFEIDRKLLVGNNNIYQIVDSVLRLTQVQPVYFKESTALVKGLPDGSRILTNAVPGAHDGMLVKEIRR
jgi:multidrug efflux pump subunit AcrA (membrane-fusion protein)